MPFCCHSYREIKFPSVVFQLKKAMANTHKKKAMARAEYFQGAKKKSEIDPIYDAGARPQQLWSTTC